jgi:hypothetical protein
MVSTSNNEKSGCQSIRTNSLVPLPRQEKEGMLTALQTACGEADVQPSLLPVNHTTGFPLCQALFELFSCFLPAWNILLPDGQNHSVSLPERRP